MRKTILITPSLLALSISSLGTAHAQQIAPSNSQPAPAANSAQPPAAKSHLAPLKKTTPAIKAQNDQILETEEDKESYAIGMSFGSSLRSQSVEVELDILMRGLKDSLSGGKTLLTEEESRAVLTALRNEVRK
jgi:hypothetical protein